MNNKRHVRWDWRLIEPTEDYKRVRTLCSVTSTPSNCGVPGITKEATDLWCRRCMVILVREIEGMEPISIVTLNSLYKVIEAEGDRFFNQESSTLPLWHPHSESINNRRWIVWEVMMNRCYNTTNDVFPQWGGIGVTVHPDWHNFKQFADDVPDSVIGVYPRSRKEISRDDCIIRTSV